MELPVVYGTTGIDWMNMAVTWSDMYFKCAIPHNGAVQAMRERK